MGDLDDFFAKKDKKKLKKTKFLTPEDLVKNLEDSCKRETTKQVKKIDILNNDGGIEEVELKADDDKCSDEEWKEFEEEQRKDYTGLKIGQLKLSNNDDECYSDDGDYNGDRDSEFYNAENGPWNKVVPNVTIEETKPKLYRPPTLMRAMQAKTRLKIAPDITNSDFFPSLGSAKPEEQRKKKNEPAFEEVRHGGRNQRVKETTNEVTKGANRFQSLDEIES